MTYEIHKFDLTDSQLNKVKNAISNNKAISITIKNNNFHGNIMLPLTKIEKEKIDEGFDSVTISLSKKKIKFIKDEKEGGFLPLLALLPAIFGGLAAAGSVAGGAAGIAKAVNDKKASDAAAEETARHNKEIESKLTSGSGIAEVSQQVMKRESSPLRQYSKSVVGVT